MVLLKKKKSPSSSFNFFKHGLEFMTQDKLILEGLFCNPMSSTNTV